MSKSFTIRGVGFGQRHPLALIAGPCVIESRKNNRYLPRLVPRQMARHSAGL